jgi:hypothetical protein
LELKSLEGEKTLKRKYKKWNYQNIVEID